MSEKETGQNERLQAELAEANKAASHLEATCHAQFESQQETAKHHIALALRVKKLEGALRPFVTKYDTAPDNEQFGIGLNNRDFICATEALSDSDRTADEVISEFLGEPVAWRFELKAGEYAFCQQKHYEANKFMLTEENHAIPLYAPEMKG